MNLSLTAYRDPLPARVFAAFGAALLLGAAILCVLGSFSFPTLASLGMLFIGAALMARAFRFTRGRGPGLLALGGVAANLLGGTALPLLYSRDPYFYMVWATPLFYVGWALVTGAAVLALIRPATSQP